MNITSIFILFISILGSYLLGSLNFAIVFTKLLDRKDIRQEGSGNAGFTNTLRCSKITTALFTFAFDFIKGILAVIVCKYLFSILQNYMDIKFSLVFEQFWLYLVGAFCVIGHIKPVFFGFKGGKGALTTSAVALAIDWRIYVLIMFVFLVVLIISKIMSMASISAAVAFPASSFVVTYFLDYLRTSSISIKYVVISSVMSMIMSLIVIYRHRENIIRLLEGKEKVISCKK